MTHAARMAGIVHTHTRSATPGRAPEHDSASLLGCSMQPQDTCTPDPQLPHTPRPLPASPLLLSQPPHALQGNRDTWQCISEAPLSNGYHGAPPTDPGRPDSQPHSLKPLGLHTQQAIPRSTHTVLPRLQTH